jgi:uncharacterized protein (TIGR02246 family)
VLIAAEPDADAIQKSVSEAADRFTEAFAKRDAKAIAALFTAQAEYVDSSGIVFHGRHTIEKEFAASMELRPAGDVDIEIISIRPIADGVMIEEGVSTFRPKEDGPESTTHYSATHVKQADGSWLLASVRELESGVATPHDRLKELAWLEGLWRQETDGTLVDTEWKWSEDGNFLISEFTSLQAGGESMRGTHRVGWDGERGQFRSWVFSADGGSADGWWTPGATGAWSVQLSGVDPLGARMTVKVTYERDGADALVISLGDRVLGGETLPEISNRVVRQPPEPGRKVTNR